ncbi:MAG: hypothetical protein QNJ13_04440 [Paracoccaceae bacterium]|nr:hypothetical protein [Paracoccaceae bacterium]
MKYILPLLALVMLGAFLGVMIWHVPSPDLVIVIVLTFAFAAFDFFRSMGKRG